jgi:IgGFc binding protein
VRTSRLAVVLLAVAASCRFDPSYRDVPGAEQPACTPGQIRCATAMLETCSADGQSWTTVTDCSHQGLSCIESIDGCGVCTPGETSCDGEAPETCDPSGQTWTKATACDPSQGVACRSGACLDLCAVADQDHSNVGCEYWAADLDQAVISPSLNAAAQQYAIVVSNVQPDVPATVTVEQDDSTPGNPPQVRTVASAVIAPQNLNVFKLGPREVDGSADGTYHTGTGTALTRHAYHVTSNMPIVAYQFNPLDNVNVFSNDASQLLPVSALNSGSGRAYVVAAWPQTIAITTDPQTNFGLNLRSFLAILGATPDTHVHIKTTARIIPGGPLTNGLAVGGEADATIQPYEVLNLETGDFNADFTGTFLDADGPIVVFPGSQASDAPFFDKLADRYCCADHLEHQETPIRAVGKTYALAKMPSRTKAVIAAGGNIGEVDEPEFYRVVAVEDGGTDVTTTLPAPWDAFTLANAGDSVTITSTHSFTLSASQAVTVLDVQSSQDAGGVPRGLPGGDPSLPNVAPIEQWRSDYVLLTPDKYVFDYLVIVAPSAAAVYLDGLPLGPAVCDVSPGDGLTTAERGSATPPYLVYTYQLSYPLIDPTQTPPNNIKPGKQNDGVHHVQANLPVGVIAYGFDSYVSYAYAGGTQLTEINVK